MKIDSTVELDSSILAAPKQTLISPFMAAGSHELATMRHELIVVRRLQKSLRKVRGSLEETVLGAAAFKAISIISGFNV